MKIPLLTRTRVVRFEFILSINSTRPLPSSFVDKERVIVAICKDFLGVKSFVKTN